MKWDKLSQRQFTTFRFPRKDRDWAVGEEVKITYKGRTKDKAVLGIARIIGKEEDATGASLTDQVAIADGFPGGVRDMERWMMKTYGFERTFDQMNKLTVEWVEGEK